MSNSNRGIFHDGERITGVILTEFPSDDKHQIKLANDWGKANGLKPMVLGQSTDPAQYNPATGEIELKGATLS